MSRALSPSHRFQGFGSPTRKGATSSQMLGCYLVYIRVTISDTFVVPTQTSYVNITRLDFIARRNSLPRLQRERIVTADYENSISSSSTPRFSSSDFVSLGSWTVQVSRALSWLNSCQNSPRSSVFERHPNGNSVSSLGSLMWIFPDSVCRKTLCHCLDHPL